MDAKGRMKMPSQLLRQLGEAATHGFVMNRGFEPCLVLYPKAEWERITAELDTLNPYDPKNRRFVRYFFRGATEMQADSADRILIPKKLHEYAAIDKDVIVFAYLNKIEIWSPTHYDAFIEEQSEDFSELAANVMRNASNLDQ